MMERGERYFWDIFTSRMSVYAYGIGSSITTAIMLYGLYAGWATMENRVAEGIPVFIEAYFRILIPFWMPPIQASDFLILLMNLFFTVVVLLHWTARYVSATSY